MSLKTQSTGDSKTHAVDMVWEGSAYEPSEGALVRFTAKLGYFNRFNVIALDEVAFTGSVASVVISKEIAEGISAAVPLFCDVQVEEEGEVKTVASFRLKFNPDITKRFNRGVVLAANALTFDGAQLTLAGNNLTFG